MMLRVCLDDCECDWDWCWCWCCREPSAPLAGVAWSFVDSSNGGRPTLRLEGLARRLAGGRVLVITVLTRVFSTWVVIETC